MSDTQDEINKRYSAMLDEFKTTGGPAFPSTVSESDGLTFKGMTLRDYFAAAAMPAINPRNFTNHDLTRMFGKDRVNITDCEMIACAAYEVADAMIAARTKGQSDGK